MQPDVKQGEITMFFDAHDARKGGETLDLTAREYELLKRMASEPDRVFSREDLLREVWGYEYFGDLRSVDVAMRRLREKIEDDSANPRYLLTRRGIGYYFARQE